MSRLAADTDIPLDQKQLDTIMATADQKTGLAVEQVDLFLQRLDEVSKAYAQAAAYQPGSIL